MKKLMIAAAIVCAAVVANAASLNWSISNVKDPSDPTKAGAKYYVAMFATACSGDTLGSLSTVVQADLLKELAGQNFKSMDKAAKTGATTDAGMVSGVAFTNVGATSDDSITAFCVIFNNEDYTKATKFSVTDSKSKTVTQGTMSGGSLSYGSQASATWTDMAPEPTSALLMLLGVAGLALRRKQK